MEVFTKSFQNLLPGLCIYLPVDVSEPLVNLRQGAERKWPFSSPFHFWYVIGLVTRDLAVEFRPDVGRERGVHITAGRDGWWSLASEPKPVVRK